MLVFKSKSMRNAVLLGVASVLVTACGGGGSTSDAPAGRSFSFNSDYLQGGFNPETADGTYFKHHIDNGLLGTSINLERWDTKYSSNQGENRGISTLLRYRSKEGSRLTYMQNSLSNGGVSAYGDMVIMTGPSPYNLAVTTSAGATVIRPGWTLNLRKSDEDHKLTNADLSGHYICMRSLPAPMNRMQRLAADFNGSGGFTYTVMQDSVSSQTGTAGTGEYVLSEDGTLELSSDSGLPLMDEAHLSWENRTAGEAAVAEAIKADPNTPPFDTSFYPLSAPPAIPNTFPVEYRPYEWARKGGYQNDIHMLFVNYMMVLKKPTTQEFLDPDFKEQTADEVQSVAYMACAKNGTGFSASSLKGSYWYASFESSIGPDLTWAYGTRFGKLTADGAGNAKRVECVSADVKRSWDMTYVVQPNGELNLSDGSFQLDGIMGADKDFAILVNNADPTQQSFDVVVSQYGADAPCP